MPSENLVIVGLGNPGPEYSMTRHNMGFLIAHSLASSLHLEFKEQKAFQAYIAKGVYESAKVHILLPTTYMNKSGQALRKYLDYLKLDNQSVLVISDDTALPLGDLRLLASGGTGSHNGLKSIQDHLGTAVYKRLRVGIGINREIPLEAYVLGPFPAAEAIKLPEIIGKGIEVVKRLLKEEFADVMKSVNTRPQASKKKVREHQGVKDESSNETKAV